MKVFISYPHVTAEMAESLATRLKAEGHEVFWDRTSLPAGESFDNRIRDAIEDSDLFVCLVTGTSLGEGHYARTELKFAQQKWPNPSGRVLPVALDAEAVDTMPSYLKAVTVQRPEGDPVAEVAEEVRRIARRPVRRLVRVARIAAVVVVVGIVGWLAFRGLPGNPIQLTMGMSGAFYQDVTEKNTQVLRGATDYLQLLDRALRGEEYADGEKLLSLVSQDEGGPDDPDVSPLPILHFRIANNSDETIVVDRLRLAVRQSRVDLRPLWWSSSTARHTNMVLNASFQLGNDGWGAADDVTFAFDLVPESGLETARRNGSRRFERDVPAVEAGRDTTVSFWDELATFGADVTFLRDGPHPFDDAGAERRFERDVAALKTAMGARADERIYAVGELGYTWGDGRSASLSLQQQLQIVYPGPVVAPAMIAEAVYDIELRPEGDDYTVDRQIAHSLAPGSAEAIDLRVWVEKSSIHDMTASIRVGEEWVEAGDSLRLEYYRPFHSIWVGSSQ